MNSFPAKDAIARINPPSTPATPEIPPDKSPDEIPSEPPPMEDPPNKNPPIMDPVIPEVNAGAVNLLHHPEHSKTDRRSADFFGWVLHSYKYDKNFLLYSFT